MLPSGHIATGVLLGLRRGGSTARLWPLGGAVVGALLPDLDLALPALLERLGVEHRLNSGHHHSWVTHTPLFWATMSGAGRRAARTRWAPGWAPETARLLSTGCAIHLLADATANTVALLWPLSRREYGLGLDRMPGVTDHLAYVRGYPRTPAGRLEAALVALALADVLRRRGAGLYT